MIKKILISIFLLLFSVSVVFAEAASDPSKPDVEKKEEKKEKVHEAPIEAKNLLKQADILARSKSFDKAIEMYQKVIKIDMDWFAPYIQLGVISVIKKDYNQGLKYFQKAYSLEPSNPILLQNMAAIYFQMGKQAEAIEYAEKSIQKKPNLFYARAILAQIYTKKARLSLKEKKSVEAEESFEKAQKYLEEASKYAFRDGEKAKLSRSSAYLYLVRGKTEDALKKAEEAVKYASNEPHGYLLLGNIYLKQREKLGMLDKAKSNYEKVMALDPKILASYYNMAIIYAIRNEKTNSLLYIKKAFDNGFKDFKKLKNEPGNKEFDSDFHNIRHLEELEEMIKKAEGEKKETSTDSKEKKENKTD